MTWELVPLSSVNSVLHLHFAAKDAGADDCKIQNKTQFLVFSPYLQTLCRLDSSVGVDTAVIATQQDNVVVGPWSVTIAVRKHGLPHIVKGLGHIWTSSLWTSNAIYSSNHLEIKKKKRKKKKNQQLHFVLVVAVVTTSFTRGIVVVKETLGTEAKW